MAKKPVTRLFRQGDVLLTPVKPKQQPFKTVPSQILAYGEVTGHKHEVFPTTAEVSIAIAEIDGTTFLRVTGGTAEVRHEEHHKIPLTPGDYEITIQREFDPILEWRNVSD